MILNRRIFLGISSLAAILLMATMFLADEDPVAPMKPVALVRPEQLIDPAYDFEPVPEGWPLDFPADHSAHPRYRTEAWSISGVLNPANTGRIGIQLSIFRLSLKPEMAERDSRWATTEVYSARLDLSNPGSGEHVTMQRTSRAAVGLAGATDDPIKIWVENWEIAGTSSRTGALNAAIEIRDEDLMLDLELSNDGPLIDGRVLEGEPTGAALPFVFYLQPFLVAAGTVNLGSGDLSVTGTVTMEHAWGELPLPNGPVGRDRFVLFMDDGRVIQIMRTHRFDDSSSAAAQGVIFERHAPPEVLPKGSLQMTPLVHWTSDRTAIAYPIEWSVSVPEHGINLRLTPESADQESTYGAPSWSGLVHVNSSGSERIGTGLMLLTGKVDK